MAFILKQGPAKFLGAASVLCKSIYFLYIFFIDQKINLRQSKLINLKEWIYLSFCKSWWFCSDGTSKGREVKYLSGNVTSHAWTPIKTWVLCFSRDTWAVKGEPALNISETAPNKDAFIPGSVASRLLLDVIIMGKIHHSKPYGQAVSWDISYSRYGQH